MYRVSPRVRTSLGRCHRPVRASAQPIIGRSREFDRLRPHPPPDLDLRLCHSPDHQNMYRQAITSLLPLPRRIPHGTNRRLFSGIPLAGHSRSPVFSHTPSSSLRRTLHSSSAASEVISSTFKGKSLPPSSSIDISESAVKQINLIQSRSKGSTETLRVLLESGGCHGFKILFDLSDKVDEEDVLFEKDGARVVINQAFLPLLAGSTVEYTQELIGSTFKIVNNPNAASGCGCGISFELK